MTILHNDTERRLWVLNDEGLYTLYKADTRVRGTIKTWIKDNRVLIDHVINAVLGQEPRS